MTTRSANGSQRPAGDAGSARALPPPGRLILASASPRRQQLLQEWGFTFVVQPADVDEESAPPNLLPAELARRLALAKARKVADDCPADIVLGADTVVAFGDKAMSKPVDADDARRMLNLLEGTTHVVITAVAVVWQQQKVELVRSVMSAVHMRQLSAAEIDNYVAGGQWYGKAGAYGIQDNDPFVTNMAGSHTNIVGLPMETTSEMLATVGVVPK